MAQLSPGVEVREIDLSLTPSIAGSSFAVFCGDFEKGPSDAIILITSVQQFIDTFGKPNNQNYNSWYQVYSFLQYSNTIYVSRAVDVEGINTKEDSGFEVEVAMEVGDEQVKVTVPSGGNISSLLGQYITFAEMGNVSKVIAVDAVNSILTLADPMTEAVDIGLNIFTLTPHSNAVAEVGENNVQVSDADLFMNRDVILNYNDFEMKQMSISKTGALKFIAKNPGAWGDLIEIAIASEADFASGVTEAFDGINLNGLFQYYPNALNKEYAIAVKYGTQIVETFLVSLNEGSKDYNNKSNFIEDVINRQSTYIYAVYAGLGTGALNTHLGTSVISLKYGTNGAISKANLIEAYDLYSDKEAIDIDIVIVPEEAHAEIIDFCTKRADVIGYVGARFEDVVGVKSTVAVDKLNTYITQTLNKDSKYVSFVGNYHYIYDVISDKMRWINCAGAMAGLRAKTNNDKEVWYASAGLSQGQLLGVTKLAQNFSNGQRDLLYKKAINVTVSFPGQGMVLWGNKTLTIKESAFSRVNTRCLFNYLERSIAKMSKYVLFENNTATTRNLFVSTVKPLFEMVLTKQGIEDYYIQCDESNNTPIVRQNHQFISSFYIKNVSSLEFLTLNFIAVNSSVSFSEVVGTV